MNEPAAIGETRTLWLLADDDIDVLVKGHAPRDVPEADRRVDDRQLGWLAALEQQGRVDLRFNRYFFTSGASQRSGVGRHLGRDGRLLLHAARDARVVVPARRRDGDLPRGIRTAQPMDGPHRGQHQQPRRRAVDRLRFARPRAFHQRVRLAALGSRRRRPRAEPHDVASDHHRVARCADCRAAVDSRGGARRRRVENADGAASRAAARDARHAHGHDHRHGARARRVGAALDDRHGRIHRRRAGLSIESRDRAARAGLSLG